jgi:hypothetical protein
MRQFCGNRRFFVTFFLALLTARTSLALSIDEKLLSLVPSGGKGKVVAGMDSPPPKGQPGSFVLITHNSRVDLRDFFALTGVDSSRIVRHAIFIAMDDNAAETAEHSLMMSGHFDQARIYKSALDGGEEILHYRGIPVVAIEPFAQDRAELQGSRWLTIPEPDLLFFGTIASVQQELDRLLDQSAPDPPW